MFVIINKNSNQIVGTTTDGTFNAGVDSLLLETGLESIEGYTYDGATLILTNPPTEPFDITITSVDGDIKHNTDFTSITLYKDDVITLTGTLEIPDTMISLPLSKNGAVDIMFPIEVVDGKFEAKVQFDSAGQYTYSDTEANLDLPEQVFHVDTIKIDVLKKVI